MNANNFQPGNAQSGNNWGVGATGGTANGAWDDVPQLSFSGPQSVPQSQWWSQQQPQSGTPDQSQAGWQNNLYDVSSSGLGSSGVQQPGWNAQNGWQSVTPTSGVNDSAQQWGSGQSWQQPADGQSQEQGPQSLLPVPYQPNSIQLQVQNEQGTSSMLMPVQNIEQLLPDLPEQEGSVYVPPMYTKPRAVIPRYRIISGFLSVLIVMLILCSGAGYYAKASGKWDAFTRFTGLSTPPPVKPTTAVNIPDPPKTETGPGKDVITSATMASRIDPNSGVATLERNVFAPNTTFYATYSVVTRGKKGGTVTAKFYTDNILYNSPQQMKIEGDKSQNVSIPLNFPAALSGKVELYWNDKLAYRLYFAVRDKP